MLDIGASSEQPPPVGTEFALERGDEGDRRSPRMTRCSV